MYVVNRSEFSPGLYWNYIVHLLISLQSLKKTFNSYFCHQGMHHTEKLPEGEDFIFKSAEELRNLEQSKGSTAGLFYFSFGNISM